jgi:hypothetical protein
MRNAELRDKKKYHGGPRNFTEKQKEWILFLKNKIGQDLQDKQDYFTVSG